MTLFLQYKTENNVTCWLDVCKITHITKTPDGFTVSINEMFLDLTGTAAKQLEGYLKRHESYMKWYEE